MDLDDLERYAIQEESRWLRNRVSVNILDELATHMTEWRYENHPCVCGDSRKSHSYHEDEHCTVWQCQCKKYRPITSPITDMENGYYYCVSCKGSWLKEPHCPNCGTSMEGK